MKESNELFELCKKCYEATGWQPTDWQHGDVNGQPIYTSDYLLEKLPKESEEIGYLDLCSDGDNWMARYTKLSATMVHQKSNTPLKALLKLTLKLHEEGLL